MRELRSSVRRGRSAAVTVAEDGVENRRRKKKTPLKTSNYNNPVIVEEEPEEDQRIRTSPSTPYEDAGMGKIEHMDILLNIIVRLPVKSIMRFRCVSKAWCKMLKDPHFVREHLNHAIEMNKFSIMILSYEMQFCSGDWTDTYTVAYDSSLSTLSNHPVHIISPSRSEDLGIDFWGTCNGIICGTRVVGNCVFLWNPATTEFKEVPNVPIEPGIEHACYKYAFGYEEEVDDIKVVSFVGLIDEDWEVHVYTLKSNSWRRLENVSYELCAENLVMSQVSVNGAPHWLASTGSEGHKVIASFCFKDDTFNQMPVPNSPDEYDVTQLCSLRGSLCLLGSIGRRTDIWEMEKYGVAKSWAKLFTIPSIVELIPLQIVNNGEVLLGYDTDDSYLLDLFSLKLGTSKNLKSYAKQDSFCATSFVYVESLVALNSGTYVGEVDKDSENDNESEGEDSANDTGAKRERPQRWVHAVSGGTGDLDNTNSGAHVERGDSKDDTDLEEKEEEEGEEEEEMKNRVPAVNEARETSPEKSYDKYNHYVEEYMNLETRKLDLETRKLDLETRKLDLETRKLDIKHMSMETSKMNASQLKWWQMGGVIIVGCKQKVKEWFGFLEI